VKRAERETILKQGVSSPETPVDRRRRDDLAEDLRGSPLRGRRLPQRLRNFRPTAEGYLASLGGPRPYMLRLLEIERLEASLEAELGEAWHALAAEHAGDGEAFARSWLDAVERWRFDEVNALIERHNRWFPVESRLPMDPRRRDYVLVNGRDYRRDPIGAPWALERFPAKLPG
jgi:hypothetical protein